MVTSKLNDKGIIFLLLIIASFFLLFGLGNNPLAPWDEGFYGEIAREIVEENLGWLTLNYNYQPWFEKPPLYIWLTASSMTLFGVNEFSVRIVSALSGIACIIVLYHFTLRLFQSKPVAFFSSLILLNFTQFLKYARLGQMDVPITFLTLLGLYFYWLSKNNKKYLLHVGMVFGLAFMTKSVIALLIPFIILVYIIITRDFTSILNKHAIFGIFISILIILPWHINQYILHGDSFLQVYVVDHVINRATKLHEHQTNMEPFYFYFKVISNNLLIGILSLIIFPVFVNDTCNLIKNKDNDRNAYLFIAVSIVCIFLVFSVSKTRLKWYIIPIYPFLSILVSLYGVSIYNKARKLKKPMLIVTIVFLTIIPTGRLFGKGSQKNIALRKICSISRGYKGNMISNIKEHPVVIYYCKRRVNGFWSTDEYFIKQAQKDRTAILLLDRESNLMNKIHTSSVKLKTLHETASYILLMTQPDNPPDTGTKKGYDEGPPKPVPVKNENFRLHAAS